MDKNGELIKGFTDAYTVRGDTKGFGGSENTRPMESGAPITLLGRSADQSATNSLGPIGAETMSDPMFDRFKHEFSDEGGGMSDIDENKVSSPGAADPVKVDSVGLAGVGDTATSDPMFERYPNVSSIVDDEKSFTK